MATIFEECRDALAEDFKIMSKDEGDIIMNALCNKYPFVSYGSGSIDWDSDKISILDYRKILEDTKNNLLIPSVYIIPDTVGIPIFKSNIFLVMKHIEDILAISFKVYILNYRYAGQSYNNEELGIRFCTLN
jgi:hypothetical protein entcl_4306